MRIALGERASGVSARDQVYLALREAIVSAELAPGRRLSENELAGSLSIFAILKVAFGGGAY